MATVLTLMLAVIAVISFTASAQEVAYVFGDSGERPLESGNLSEYNGTDVVTSSIASAAYGGGTASRISTTSVDDIEREINLKINMRSRAVMDKASSLVLDYPGDGTIGQICSIYEYMVGNWSYKRDPRGIEIFQYSNQSLEYGNGKYSGQGDCDDFSILQASLVESIGCTSRIVLAYGLNGGHAYAEVYLGKAGGPESDTGRMIAWLKKKYRVNEINYHTDLKTGDVWLNLDWWKEPGGANHPGGPLYRAAKQVPIWIREDVAWDALKPMNEPPIAQLSVSPLPPVVGENTTFNASESRDIGGRVEAYLWDFGDGNKTEKISEPVSNHVYLKGGSYTVNLTVWDNDGVANSSIQNMMINNPPQANFTIEPQNPKVGDQIKFDASDSWDAEDGRNLAYNWVINNNSATFTQACPPRQVYDEAGMYWINLTVSDTNGAVGHKNYLLKINQPPIARIVVDNSSLSLGNMINFSAGLSEDPDGEIIGYTWDFGDNNTTHGNKTAFHRYHDGGEKTVKLFVMDNDGAMNSSSETISINIPPKAMFTINLHEPDIGEPISFNASSSFDEDGNISKYSWDFGEGRIEPEVYTSAFITHAYYRPQEYNVTLFVEDDRGAVGSFSKPVAVGMVNIKPSIINLTSDRLSPLEAGTEITWTAVASDQENDQLQFQFSLDGDIMKDWSDDPSWSWTPSKEQAGDHIIEARIRDGKHAGLDSSDDRRSLNFTVNHTASDSSIPGNSSGFVETGSSDTEPTSGKADSGLVEGTSNPITNNTTSIANMPTSRLDGYKRVTVDTSDSVETQKNPSHSFTGSTHDVTYSGSAVSISNPITNNTTETTSVLALSRSVSAFWLERGDELFASGKCDEAIEAYNKSYILDSKDARPLFGKGKAFFAEGKYEEALLWLTDAIELSPQYKLLNSVYADMWIYRGNALKKLGRDLEAEMAFDKAEDLDPSRHPDLEAVVESCARTAT